MIGFVDVGLGDVARPIFIGRNAEITGHAIKTHVDQGVAIEQAEGLARFAPNLRRTDGGRRDDNPMPQLADHGF